MNHLLRVLAVAALVLGGVWLGYERAGSEEAMDRVDHQAEAIPPSRAAALASGETPVSAPVALAASGEDTGQGREERVALGEKKPADELVLAGSLIVIEPDGTALYDVDARIEFTFQHITGGPQGAPQHRITVDSVPVENGQWEARFRREPDGNYGRLETEPSSVWSGEHGPWLPQARIEIDVPPIPGRSGSLELEGPGVPDPFGDPNGPRFGDEDLILVAHRQPPFRLFVEDADTGVPLDEICVRSAPDQARPGDLPLLESSPSADSVLKRDAASPIEFHLPRRARPGRNVPVRAPSRFFVGRAGYAWAVVELNLREGHELHMQLERGADMDLRIEGSQPPPGSELRVFREDDPVPVWKRGVTELGTHELPGLREGHYEVRVETGDFWDSPLVLGRTSAFVQAGHTKTVELILDDVPQLREAVLAGILVAPAEMDLERSWLALDLVDTPLDGTTGHHVIRRDRLQPLQGVGSTFGFDFKRLQIGRYKLRLQPQGYGIEFELPAAGISNLRLEIPRLVEVQVRARNARTGKFVRLESLSVLSNPGGANRLPISTVAGKPDAEGRFVLRVPPGQLTLSNNSRQYTPGSRSLEVTQDREVVLDVYPAE